MEKTKEWHAWQAYRAKKLAAEEDDYMRLLKEFYEHRSKELMEESFFHRMACIDEEYIVCPVEVFEKILVMYTDYQAMMKVWQRVINEEIETCFGVELFRYFSNRYDEKTLLDAIAVLKAPLI